MLHARFVSRSASVHRPLSSFAARPRLRPAAIFSRYGPADFCAPPALHWHKRRPSHSVPTSTTVLLLWLWGPLRECGMTSRAMARIQRRFPAENNNGFPARSDPITRRVSSHLSRASQSPNGGGQHKLIERRLRWRRQRQRQRQRHRQRDEHSTQHTAHHNRRESLTM